ncbi:MAG: DUF1178 family protein [Limnohabitans sp.]|nr:DUF1178 family protein [Limnohabitans sp.]
MKVLNLQCQQHHLFEGWFASEDDYQTQRSRDLVECPVCGDNNIHKMLSAPRLNLLTSRLDSAQAPQAADAAAENGSDISQAVLPATLESQAAWLQMVQHVIANTEDVGQNFAEEARKMHYGETQERNIRGQVSRQETRSLLEEGIKVMPLPLPAALKGPVH